MVYISLNFVLDKNEYQIRTRRINKPLKRNISAVVPQTELGDNFEGDPSHSALAGGPFLTNVLAL